MNKDQIENEAAAVAETEESADQGRRETLAKLAKWTPPAMLTLLLSTRPASASFGGPPGPPVNP